MEIESAIKSSNLDELKESVAVGKLWLSEKRKWELIKLAMSQNKDDIILECFNLFREVEPMAQNISSFYISHGGMSSRKYGADLNLKCFETQKSPVSMAIQNKNPTLLKILLDLGADVNNTNDDLPPIHLVFALDNLECCEIIASSIDFNISIFNFNNHTVLHDAVLSSDANFIHCLLSSFPKKLIDAEFRRPADGMTPLHLAAEKGQETIARLLVGRGLSEEFEDFNGRSARDIRESVEKDKAVERANVEQRKQTVRKRKTEILEEKRKMDFEKSEVTIWARGIGVSESSLEAMFVSGLHQFSDEFQLLILEGQIKKRISKRHKGFIDADETLMKNYLEKEENEIREEQEQIARESKRKFDETQRKKFWWLMFSIFALILILFPIMWFCGVFQDIQKRRMHELDIFMWKFHNKVV